jgi:regulator of sigma E protease
MDLAVLEYVLWFIVSISVLVAAHEFGHYIVARRLGFKVLRFSIGFGRPLLAWRGKAPDHIEYWVSMIPLGGYVKMLDEHEGPVVSEDRHRAFHQRPVWQRVAVLLAGPAFNFIFAVIAYWLMFVTGVQALKPVIGMVEPGSVAAAAGLASGDIIESVGGEATATWENATLGILDELLADGRIDLTVRKPDGTTRTAALDVGGREHELTEPDALFKGLGVSPGPAAVVGTLNPGAAGERAGLEPGDRIVRGNGNPIEGWDQWVEFLQPRPGETIELTVLRGNREVVLHATLDSVVEGDKTIGQIGVRPPSLVAEQRYGLLDSVPRAIEKTWDIAAFSVSMVANMIVGDVSLKNMSGPLSIADIAGDSANAGLAYYLSFLAMVSISLGILNLLPIPLLDGGQIVYQLAEAVKGAPLSERAMVLGQQIGIFFVIALTGFAFYNDIVRLFGS